MVPQKMVGTANAGTANVGTVKAGTVKLAPQSTPLMTLSFGRSWGALLWRDGKEGDREVDA